MARSKQQQDDARTATGFVARSRTGMIRRRDGVPFFPEPYSYPGSPTEAQRADVCLQILPFDAAVPPVSEAVAARQAALEQMREAEARLTSAYVGAAVPRPEDEEV